MQAGGGKKGGIQKGFFEDFFFPLTVLLVRIPLETKDLPSQQPNEKNSQDFTVNYRCIKCNRK